MDTFTGIVEAGSHRAAALGFPTINIPLPDKDVSGIYAALVKVGEEEYEGVAFADQRRKLLEAHIFDFSKDLYGWNVKIHLLKKVRENKKFTDDSSLKEAIMDDIATVQAYFKK